MREHAFGQACPSSQVYRDGESLGELRSIVLKEVEENIRCLHSAVARDPEFRHAGQDLSGGNLDVNGNIGGDIAEIIALTVDAANGKTEGVVGPRGKPNLKRQERLDEGHIGGNSLFFSVTGGDVRLGMGDHDSAFRSCCRQIADKADASVIVVYDKSIAILAAWDAPAVRPSANILASIVRLGNLFHGDNDIVVCPQSVVVGSINEDPGLQSVWLENINRRLGRRRNRERERR